MVLQNGIRAFALAAMVSWASASPTARAATLVLAIEPVFDYARPGDTLIFAGTVANGSAFSIDSANLFLNFTAFDPALVQLDQLLGPGFVIAPGGISALLPLFSFRVDPLTPMPTLLFADVSVQDDADNFSEPVTVTVFVPAPAALALLGLGAAALVVRRRPRR